MKKIIILIGTIAFLLMISVFTIAAEDTEEIRLRIGAGHTVEGYTWIEALAKYFIPHVDEKLAETGNYKINWIEAWGGTLVGVDECLEAVQDGILDITFVGNVFEASKLPLNNISYFVPFNVRLFDQEQMVEAHLAMYDKFPELKEELERYRNKFLGVACLENYNLTTNFEVTKMDDFQGHKIGAAGANLNWVEVTGAIPVQAAGPDWYPGLQTGIFDAVLAHLLMIDTIKLYEVGPYVTIGDFGAVNGGEITINIDLFESLPREVQQALVEAGEVYTHGLVELELEKMSRVMDKFEADEKVKVTMLSDEDREKWANMVPNLPKIYGQQLDDMGYKGTEMIKAYIGFLEEAGADMPRKWFNE